MLFSESGSIRGTILLRHFAEIGGLMPFRRNPISISLGRRAFAVVSAFGHMASGARRRP
jgi:hypothetical protein